MLYLLIVQIVLLLLARRLAPVRHAVHAARADGSPAGSLRGRWIGAGFVRDEKGQRVPIKGKFIGSVGGDSMKAYGLPCGATFVGDRLTIAQRRELQEGALVVINAPAKYSPTGFRLRCVDEVRGDGFVTFKRDSSGRSHRARRLDEVVVKVTHVVP
ncbi:MAG TPA: hypothetical protein VD906_13160 [Caulobacteraceae bacterium]|nr:hypothetical protein [Caulobacteraceae bacterium]